MLPDELPEQARPLPDQDRGAHSYTVRGVNIDGKPNACRIEVHLRLQKLFVAKVHDNCERELKNNGHYTWNSNSEIPRNIRWEWFAYLQEAWDYGGHNVPWAGPLMEDAGHDLTHNGHGAAWLRGMVSVCTYFKCVCVCVCDYTSSITCMLIL